MTASGIPAVRPPQPRVPPAAALSPLAEEVRRGLSVQPKRLSPWIFYDAEGSRLFEQITELPEYYLTRAEREIFAAHAPEIIARARRHADGAPLHLLELGAGNAAKTGLLLAAAMRVQGSALYQPIDVSSSALQQARRNLQQTVPGALVEPHVADYTRGYQGLTRPAGPRLALFIGSSIGNFEPLAALQVLRELRAQLRSGDSFLVGVDRRKDPAILLPAYNDAAGVTAAFNRNALARINRELGANFDLNAFRHAARWNSRLSRIEMYLVSTRAQTAGVAALDQTFHFAAGETIHTENSYKYSPQRLKHLLHYAGFTLQASWQDSNSYFLVALCAVAHIDEAHAAGPA